MQHAVVGEAMLKTKRFILHVLCSKDDFFAEYAGDTYNRVFVRCKYSGRVDEIRIITHESHIFSYRFDGQIIPISDSFAVDGLLMYVRRQLRPISRCKDAADDPETLFWHWASESLERPSDERDCFRACIESMRAQQK